MNADGTGKVPLTKGAHHGLAPSWSPDGKRIRTVVKEPVTNERFFVDSAWTPEGKILWVHDWDVYAIYPDGSGRQRLTTVNSVGEFALSPDGKTIAYHDLSGNRIQVVPLSRGATRVTLLEPVSDYIKDPLAAIAWAPSGDALALSSSGWYSIVGSPLYIVNVDGTGLSSVPGIDDASGPTWWQE